MNESFMAIKKPNKRPIDSQPSSSTTAQRECSTLKIQRFQVDQQTKAFDGYFLDQAITFRKRNCNNQQSQPDLTNLKNQTVSIQISVPKVDLNNREQRAKTELFEYSEQMIEKEINSLNFKAEEAVRLPNLSSQISAFKQERNTFLKELVRQKCKEKLTNYKKTSLKSLPCEKIWLKRKRSFTLNSKSSTQQLKKTETCKNGSDQLTQLMGIKSQNLKLYRKAIVMALPQNYQASLVHDKTALEVKFRKIGSDGETKQIKVAGRHQLSKQTLGSLIISNKSQELYQQLKKAHKRASSSNSISNGLKKSVRMKIQKMGRIKSTCSEYAKEGNCALSDCVNVVNMSKKTHKGNTQEQGGGQEGNETLATRTKKKMMSIFKKMKLQKNNENGHPVHPGSVKGSTSSLDCLAKSIKIDSKEACNISCFRLKQLGTETVKAKSTVLRSVKEDLKLNRANIIDSLKLFSESRKTTNILSLLNNQGIKVGLRKLQAEVKVI